MNREARRLGEKLDGWSEAAISRRLAERVADGAEVRRAVLDVFEDLRMAPGQVIPIEAVGEVQRREVSVSGTVIELWQPSHPKIAQVGLLEDESGRVKFTSWVRSRPRFVREGDHVTFRNVAKNWYNGRVSIAVTGRSQVRVL